MTLQGRLTVLVAASLATVTALPGLGAATHKDPNDPVESALRPVPPAADAYRGAEWIAHCLQTYAQDDPLRRCVRGSPPVPPGDPRSCATPTQCQPTFLCYSLYDRLLYDHDQPELAAWVLVICRLMPQPTWD